MKVLCPSKQTQSAKIRINLLISYTPSEAAPFPLALQNKNRKGMSIYLYLGQQSAALIKNQSSELLIILGFSSEAQNNYIVSL